MKKALYITAFLLIVSVPLNAETCAVSALEFHGLSRLSKYRLLEGVPAKKEGTKVYIDCDALRSKLSAHPYVASFRVDEKGDRLRITVRERDVLVRALVVREKGTLLFEMDDAMNVILRGRHYGYDVPLIRLDGRFDEGEVMRRIRFAAGMLRWVKMNEPSLFRELETVSFTGDGRWVLTLRKRPVVIYSDLTQESFRKLKYLAGYLDRIQVYPDSVHIGNSWALLKRD